MTHTNPIILCIELTEEEKKEREKFIHHRDTIINNNSWTRKIFKNTDDQQQCAEIFEIINKSELIINCKVPHDITKEIAQFGTGSFVKCCKDGCDGFVCFLNPEKEEEDECDLETECQGCNTTVYLHSCVICEENVTSLEDVGDHCEDCENPCCGDHINVCIKCNKYLCVNCWNLKNYAMRCYDCLINIYSPNYHCLNS